MLLRPLFSSCASSGLLFVVRPLIVQVDEMLLLDVVRVAGAFELWFVSLGNGARCC